MATRELAASGERHRGGGSGGSGGVFCGGASLPLQAEGIDGHIWPEARWPAQGPVNLARSRHGTGTTSCPCRS